MTEHAKLSGVDDHRGADGIHIYGSGSRAVRESRCGGSTGTCTDGRLLANTNLSGAGNMAPEDERFPRATPKWYTDNGPRATGKRRRAEGKQ
jgi:hypothetical protein